MRTFPGCMLPVLAGLSLVALLLVSGCEPAVPGVVDGSCTAERRAEVMTEDYFATVMKAKIFTPYCSRCHDSSKTGAARHGAPSGVDYDTLEAASQIQTTTWFRVSTYDMPPMGRVPNLEQMALLNEWLNCAVPVSGDDDDSAL